MKKIIYENEFVCDYQKYRRQGPVDIEEMAYLAEELAAGRSLDPGFKDHDLFWNWGGYREFHLAADLLIIYRLTKTKIIFSRMGTHDELFG